MSSKTVNFIVEGYTEKAFVNNVLREYLAHREIYVHARCVLTAKDKKKGKYYKGGLNNYLKIRNDIISWMKEEKRNEVYFTTFCDLYRLPNDFPNYADAQRQNDPYDKVCMLEAAFKHDVLNEVGQDRFIPYIQVHEFEALVLANPEKLSLEYLEHEEAIEKLVTLVHSFDNKPELINDGYQTAPSKRILKEIPEYKKLNVVPTVLKEIGVDALRKHCPHFNDWLKNIEAL